MHDRQTTPPGPADAAAPGPGRAPAGPKLSIDVVIPVYNRWDLTRQCLGSLAQQTVRHQVIVADDGSTDDTPEQIRSHHPEVRLIQMPENLPLSVASNRAAATGDGEVIVWLNNDVLVRPDFLERLIEPLAADDHVGSATALLVRPGEQLIDSVGLVVDRTLAAYPRLTGHPAAGAGATGPTLTGPAGAAAAYRRTAWEQVGGLDEHLFAYMEDVDIALRLRGHGWTAAVALDAIGVHLGGATFGRGSAWQRRNGGFSRGYMLRRYGVLRTRAAARAIAVELLASLADMVISRDAAALRGRLSGWRCARQLPRHPYPPRDAIDWDLSPHTTLALRRDVQSGRQVDTAPTERTGARA